MIDEMLVATGGRPPVIAHHPNGIQKLHCSCGAVLVWNPAVSTEPPRQCAFCNQRYDWSPSKSGAEANPEERSDVPSTTPEQTERTASAPDFDERSAPLVFPKRYIEPVTIIGPSEQAGRCQHSLDQIGGKRCIRCCATRNLSYVWRNAAGSSPGAFRWLCGPCLRVYEGLGLVGAPRTHVNGFTDGYAPKAARSEREAAG